MSELDINNSFLIVYGKDIRLVIDSERKFIVTTVDAELELDYRVNSRGGALVIRGHFFSAEGTGSEIFLFDPVRVD